MSNSKRTSLTPRAIDALLWARDNGGAWRYEPGRSLPWSAPRDKMIARLVGAGLLANDGPNTITEAGRAYLNEARL